MDAKICDRCGAVYGNEKGKTKILLPCPKYENVGRPWYGHTDELNMVDLCDKCADELLVWFKAVE